MTDYLKRVKTLVIVDVALALLIVLGIVFSPRSSEARSARHDLLSSAGSVVSIKIGGPEKLELVRSGDAWSMVSADGAVPADRARIESFLKAVDSVVRLDPVAEDASSWAPLGLEGEQARRVTLTGENGAVLCDFVLGNYAQSPGAVYLALSDGAKAYSAESGMASYILGARTSWLDLRAWTTPPAVESVQEFSVRGSVEGEGGSVREFDYSVSRSGSGWVSGGTVLDNAKVEALLRAIAAVRGDDYAPATEPAGPAVVSMELRLGNGRSLNLAVEAKRGDGRYAASSSQRDRRLYVPAWSITEALRTLDELKAAPGS